MPFVKDKILIAGMDEAGRGAWAGPVLAAAVILPKGTRLPGLNDSKLLTAKKRDELFKKIIQKCPHGIGSASHEEIDKFGLIKATFKAFERALQELQKNYPHSKPQKLYIDGRDKFHFKIPHESFIKGDQKFRCIAAASILAKVSRDHIMQTEAKNQNQYAFEKHKGYGTKHHQAALKKHGPGPWHRKSYAPIKEYSCTQPAFL